MGWSCHFHSFKVIFDYFINLSQHHRCWQKTVLGVPTENWSLHPVAGEGTETESGIWRATQAPTGFYLENHIQQSKQCRHCCIFKVFHLFSAALFHLLASGCWLAHVDLSWSHCEAARYGFVWRAPMGTPSSRDYQHISASFTFELLGQNTSFGQTHRLSATRLHEILTKNSLAVQWSGDIMSYAWMVPMLGEFFVGSSQVAQ